MTPEEAVNAMAERLAAIDYQRHGDKAWSKTALIREYFRRAARWADAYGCDIKTPFFDIASPDSKLLGVAGAYAVRSRIGSRPRMARSWRTMPWALRTCRLLPVRPAAK